MLLSRWSNRVVMPLGTEWGNDGLGGVAACMNWNSNIVTTKSESTSGYYYSSAKENIRPRSNIAIKPSGDITVTISQKPPHPKRKIEAVKGSKKVSVPESALERKSSGGRLGQPKPGVNGVNEVQKKKVIKQTERKEQDLRITLQPEVGEANKAQVNARIVVDALERERRREGRSSEEENQLVKTARSFYKNAPLDSQRRLETNRRNYYSGKPQISFREGEIVSNEVYSSPQGAYSTYQTPAYSTYQTPTYSTYQTPAYSTNPTPAYLTYQTPADSSYLDAAYTYPPEVAYTTPHVEVDKEIYHRRGNIIVERPCSAILTNRSGHATYRPREGDMTGRWTCRPNTALGAYNYDQDLNSYAGLNRQVSFDLTDDHSPIKIDQTKRMATSTTEKSHVLETQSNVQSYWQMENFQKGSTGYESHSGNRGSGLYKNRYQQFPSKATSNKQTVEGSGNVNPKKATQGNVSLELNCPKDSDMFVNVRVQTKNIGSQRPHFEYRPALE